MNIKDFKALVVDVEFEHEVNFPDFWSISNPRHIELFIDEHDSLSESCEMINLAESLKTFNAQKSSVPNDDLKLVFAKLKGREINPKGEFDSAGRFYLEDSELVDVRSPSAKYPYSQMTAGRTAKFVKAIAEKYKCDSLESLESLFS